MIPKKDTSTINMALLSSLPIYNGFYRISDSEGSGCYLDPPGYPSYFIRHIYTASGNEPRSGATAVIMNRVIESQEDWKDVKDYDEFKAKKDKLLHDLWNPLPIGHPRTKAWIIAVYKHLNRCYFDKNAKKKEDETLIFPVPHYKLKAFHDDERFSDEWREKEKASVNQKNKEIIEHALSVAVPENHMAVQLIRRFYPEYQPDMELINNPPKRHVGDWWERYSEQMKPEDCPGLYGTKHPASGNWCQMCGWYKEDDEV